MTRASMLLLVFAMVGCGSSLSRREILEQVAFELDTAYSRFDERDFDGCIAACDRALQVDPSYDVAMELRQDAVSMKFRAKYATFSSARWVCWN